MPEYLKNQYIQCINLIWEFIEFPTGFSKEDWEDWRPLIAKAYQSTTDQTLKNKGLETIERLNQRYFGAN